MTTPIGKPLAKMTDQFAELSELLAAYCDDRLSDDQAMRLEGLASQSPKAMRFFVEYMHLHGMLYWDAAGAAVPLQEDAISLLQTQTSLPDDRDAVTDLVGTSADANASRPSTRHRRVAWGTVTAVIALLTLGTWGYWSSLNRRTQGPDGSPVANNTNDPTTPVGEGTNPAVEVVSPVIVRLGNGQQQPNLGSSVTSREGMGSHSPNVAVLPESTGGPKTGTAETLANGQAPPTKRVDGLLVSSQAVVAQIDDAIERIWEENGVAPAAIADDAEWIRRVHLDLVGHIPEPRRVVAFLADKRSDRRERLVDELLDDPDFSRHFATTWTNLLIGRTSSQEVDRGALAKYLREQFHRNRPWTETVTDLVAAEGFEDEKGATNFLLAHLNNEAVPATAVTCRVLLCEQVQCTQCHKHPTGEWSQNRFWELNAFFQQTDIVRHRRNDPKTGAKLPDRLELVNLDVGGPTFFENRQEEMKVAYPVFDGCEVDPGQSTNRRAELARILTQGDRPQVARAFVNRMWGTFFGYGFTLPIDDMGPHNQPAHPELLDTITSRFVQSGYDVKQLARWICLSKAYQLSSVPATADSVDTPENGNVPIFSRMYVRSLSAEQLYDSLLVATHADRAKTHSWEEVERRRQAWLEQFYAAIENEENGESDTFNGSYTQALALMNGDLIRRATEPAPGTVLHDILSSVAPESEKIRQLSLVTLSRYPTSQETSRIKRLLKQSSNDPRNGLELGDLMWAYLNSAEFRSIH
ncbi:MAG: DUF1549 and DUF1553 domain-containing protein [Planctomycetaceae bacterium]